MEAVDSLRFVVKTDNSMRSRPAIAGNGRDQPAPASARVAMAVLDASASGREVRRLVEAARSKGLAASYYDLGPGVIVFPAIDTASLEDLTGDHHAVQSAFMPDSRYRLVRREVNPGGSVVSIGGVEVGGDQVVLMAGPCAVEDPDQIREAARFAAEAGATVLRGGAFKPRTSPYNFQGLGLHGVELLAETRAETGLPFVTEVMEIDMIEPMYPLVDGFQVGARNMQNFDLLRALGEVDKPVILKRGPAATLDEWLLAAEYVLAGGNDQVILCERGIRTFNDRTRFTLDLGTMALAKRETHLPVIVDPSHATGDPGLVPAMALAAIAGGADGVMVEVHPDPSAALSDGFQALTGDALRELGANVARVAEAVGRSLAASPQPAQGARR